MPSSYDTLNYILQQLRQVRKTTDDRWAACCPAHRDDNPSLSIKYTADGCILLKCHAGCELESVLNALNLKKKDLFPLNNSNPKAISKPEKPEERITLQDLAADKKLPPAFLAACGVEQMQGGGVKITYRLMNGQPAAKQRLRYTLKANNGSRWTKKGSSIVLYGLWYLPKIAEKYDHLILVEGESDCWSLWYHKIPALGFPGAKTTKKIQKSYVERFKRLYIWQEPDEGGMAFVSGICRRLLELKYPSEVFVIKSEKAKDPNELHKQNPDHEVFAAEWGKVMRGAAPLSLKNLPEEYAKANDEASPKTKKPGPDDPERFFDGNIFVCKRLADEITAKFNVKKIYDELRIYHDGIYRPNGEAFLKKYGADLLRELYRPNRIDAAIRYISDTHLNEEPHMNPTTINLLNGRLNWATKKLLPHDPELPEIIQIPIRYDPAADCPVFKKYLETTFKREVIPLVLELMGYLLIPSTVFQKAVMLYGSGNNGKSVFIHLIESFVGKENVVNKDLQSLEENRFAVADLAGKLINTAADISDRALQTTSVFKSITGGDRITAERKFGQPFSFVPFARLIFSANRLPFSKDRTYAYYKRWIIIPFSQTFDEQTADKQLLQKLKREEELSGILNLALEGLVRLTENGQFTEPELVQTALEEYKIANDSVLAFIKEKVRIAENGFISKRGFYQQYCDWCHEQGCKPFAEKIVKERLLENFPHVRETRPDLPGRPRGWSGIMLIENEEKSLPDLYSLEFTD